MSNTGELIQTAAPYAAGAVVAAAVVMLIVAAIRRVLSLARVIKGAMATVAIAGSVWGWPHIQPTPTGPIPIPTTRHDYFSR